MAATKPYKLTKSKLLSYRQCSKRLHLEVFQPGLAIDDKSQQRITDQGYEVGAKARELCGPGPVIDIRKGAEFAVAETQRLLTLGEMRPIYEAAFLFGEVLVLADIVLPKPDGLHIVEVKSSTEVKDVHLLDCAVQYWAMAGAGYRPASIRVDYINSKFKYRGDGNYDGLFTSNPVDADVARLLPEIPSLIAAAKRTLEEGEPNLAMGPHCFSPYECPFQSHCEGPQTDFPIKTLPRIGIRRWELESAGYRDIRDIPERLLTNPDHLRVWRAARTGQMERHADPENTIRNLGYPRHYLDFETIQFALPIWVDTSPYEQLPFQWSCLIEQVDGTTKSVDFLDISGQPPMRRCAEALIETMGRSGPIISYSAFESRVIKEMARRHPDLAPALQALLPRIVDLLPITRRAYYHPGMAGSWSIKKVLPTIAPDLDYGALEEVRDGGEAQVAYLEAISTQDARRKGALERHLLKYCGQDVEAMVRVARFLDQQMN